MGKFKKSARGTLFIFLGSILGSGFAYLFRMVLTRRISVEEYGLFASVLAFITLFEVFRSWGLSQSLVKFVSRFFVLEEKEKGNKIVYIVLIVETLLAVLLASGIKLFDQVLALNYFKQSFAVFIINWGLVYFLLETISSIFQYSFQGIQKVFLYGLKKPLFNIFSFLAVLIIPFNGASLPISSVTLALLGSTIVLGIFFFKNFSIPKLKISDFKEYLPRLLSFGFPVALASLGAVAIAQFDTIMLTSMKGLRDVGVYNIILPFALILSFLGQGLEGVLFPLVSEFEAKESFNRIKNGFDIAYKFGITGSLFLSLPLFLFSDILLGKFFGADYIVGTTAFRILLIGTIFLIIGSINMGVLFGLGKSKKVAKVSFISASANIVLNLLLIPKWGINGAASTTLISFVLSFLLGFIFLRKEINISFPWMKSVLISLSWVISLTLGLYLMSLDLGIWIKLISSLLASLSLFIIFTFSFNILKFKDIKDLILIIKKE